MRGLAFTFKCNDTVRRLIRALASQLQGTESDVVRWLIHNAARELNSHATRKVNRANCQWLIYIVQILAYQQRSIVMDPVQIILILVIGMLLAYISMLLAYIKGTQSAVRDVLAILTHITHARQPQPRKRNPSRKRKSSKPH